MILSSTAEFQSNSQAWKNIFLSSTSGEQVNTELKYKKSIVLLARSIILFSHSTPTPLLHSKSSLPGL